MGRIAKPRYGKFGGERIEINDSEIQEQCDLLIASFLAFPVNLRKKHIGAAWRRAGVLRFSV